MSCLHGIAACELAEPTLAQRMLTKGSCQGPEEMQCLPPWLSSCCGLTKPHAARTGEGHSGVSEAALLIIDGVVQDAAYQKKPSVLFSWRCCRVGSGLLPFLLNCCFAAHPVTKYALAKSLRMRCITP